MRPQENEPKKSSGIRVISLWLMALPLPGLYRDFRQGLEVVMSPLTTLEWGYYLIGVVCAIGLLRFRPWARTWSIGLFILQFVWLLLVTYLLTGPTLAQVIAAFCSLLNISPVIFKSILAVLFSGYIVWLFVAIFYLFHPRIKLQFGS